MLMYKLRDKSTGLFYKGSGFFNKKGTTYTSIGHIKNSLKQAWDGRFPKSGNYELITYEVVEKQKEDFNYENK